MDKKIQQEINSLLMYFGKGWPKVLRCDRGWYPLIVDCHKELLAVDPNYTICQIKEKFGTLRYYVDASDPELASRLEEIVSKYEVISGRTCEISGQEGQLMVKNGMFKTLNKLIAPDGFIEYYRA